MHPVYKMKAASLCSLHTLCFFFPLCITFLFKICCSYNTEGRKLTFLYTKPRAIHWAAHYGHLETLNSLITDLKCSPNIPGQCGCMPLHYAAGGGHVHIMKYLINEQGCDPSCLDRNKQTNTTSPCCALWTFRHCELPHLRETL